MGMKVPTDKEKAGRRTGRMNAGGDSNGSAKNSPVKTPSKQQQKQQQQQQQQPPEEDKTSSFSKELARLQFFGAGPKMAGMPGEKTMKEKTRGVKLNFEYDPVRLLTS